MNDDDVEVVTVEGLDNLPTEEQVRADVMDRRTFIGGSDAPVILGLTGWKSRYDLYLEKTGQVEPADLSEVERVQWGIVLEDVVATMYTRRTGKKTRRVTNRIIDKKAPFPRAAQIDRRIVGGGILEIKTTDASQAGEWGPEGTAEIPAHYYTQVQHQLAVTGESFAEVAVLIGGNRMRLYLVPADPEFIADMTVAEGLFWRACETRVPPPPVTLDDAKKMWGEAPEYPVMGSDDDLMVARELLAVRAELDALTDREEALELKLKESIRDIGTTLTVNGAVIATWKNQKRTIPDAEGLKRDHPELAETYRKEITSRVFRLSEKGIKSLA